jgi:DNA polymerase (family 10)
VKNQEIAKIFYEIAFFLEMEGVQFKPFAYEKAAITLEGLEEDVEEIYKKGGFEALRKIPGVGESIAQKIEEYLKTGKIKYYEDYKKKYPINLEELMGIEGVGPKRIKILYEKLGITNLKELEEAAKAHKIAPLFGFGEKTEKNILEAIEFAKRSKGRFLLGEILPRVKEVYGKLKSLKEIERIDVVGSIRRMKETIGDVDFLVISKKPQPIMDFFVSLPGVIKIWGTGSTKSSVRM